MNNVKDSVLNKIKQGEVAMRPRWHFMLKGVLALSGICILTLWLIYLLSFVVFALVTSGVIMIPAFGVRGVVEVWSALRWGLIFIAAVFIILLEILVNRYSFGYRKPLLYTLFAIISFTIVGTFVVSKTGIHELAMQRSVESRLPVMGHFYKGYGLPPHERISVGEILLINKNGFVLNERVEGRLNVTINDYTKVPTGAAFGVGDQVVVFGLRQEDEIEAWGVKPFYGKMFRPSERTEKMRFQEESEL